MIGSGEIRSLLQCPVGAAPVDKSLSLFRMDIMQLAGDTFEQEFCNHHMCNLSA